MVVHWTANATRVESRLGKLLWFVIWLLLAACDVEQCPGPNYKHPCGVCGKPVKSNQAGIQYEVCYYWLHTKCIHMSPIKYSRLQQSPESWSCGSCYKEAFPYHDYSSTSIFEASCNFSMSLHNNSITPPPSPSKCRINVVNVE